MSIAFQSVFSQALLMLEVYDPGETPSTSEQNQGLLVANQLLESWYNEQVQALQVLIASQDQAGSVFVKEQTKVTQPLSTSYVLAGGTYTPPSYTAGSFTPGSAPQFADLTTPLTLPSGYEWAIVMGVAVALAPQYVGDVSETLMTNYQAAREAANPVPGRIPVPGTGFQGTVTPPPDAEEVSSD